MSAAPAAAHRFRQGPRICWPEAFGRRFAVFVDVEEEFDWRAPFSRAARAVTAIGALPAMDARFAAHGIGATYLVDHPVATDSRAIDALRGIAATPGAEIGTQLHPWVNPPDEEMPGRVNSFVGNLSRALEAAKLDALTDAITAAFGRRPRVYRAGRYGLGPHSLALLADRGYRVDTSMRARHDYRGEGGPDYRAIGIDAFRTGPGDAILELPATTLFTGTARRFGGALHDAAGHVPHGRGVLARARLLSRVPLTPEGTTAREAVEAIRLAAGEGVRLLSLSFHSPSLVPGHTPYVRHAADLAAFHAWWDAVLAALDRAGIRPVSLDAILKAADPACQPAAASATPNAAHVGL